jgi:hypothetical protein
MSLKWKSKHNLNNPHQESKDDGISKSHEQNFKILQLGDTSKISKPLSNQQCSNSILTSD